MTFLAFHKRYPINNESHKGFEFSEKKVTAVLSEEEQRKMDELANEFTNLLTPKKYEDFSQGLDSGSAF